MKTAVHVIDGASLERIEELASKIDYRVPDWVPYNETQHFSGLLRQLSNAESIEGAWGYIENGLIPDESGKQHEIFDVLEEAAERLDQAHQEWLENQCGQGIKLAVYFGYEMERQEFTFNSAGERDAFISGMQAADGWSKFVTAEEYEEYESVQRVGHYWENTWTNEYGGGETFDRYQTAEKALREHLADADAAKLDYDPADFKIVPVGYF